MLPVPKAIREQAGAGPENTINVELWKDDEPRTLEVPARFQQAMKKAGVAQVFDKLSYTHRREYCRWIAGAKKEETRLLRIEKAVEMLRSGVKTPDAPRPAQAQRIDRRPHIRTFTPETVIRFSYAYSTLRSRVRGTHRASVRRFA